MDGVKKAWESIPQHPVAAQGNIAMRRALSHLGTDAWHLVDDWAPWADLGSAPDGDFVVVEASTGRVLGTDLVLVAVADVEADEDGTTMDEVRSDPERARTMAARHGTPLRGRVRPDG